MWIICSSLCVQAPLCVLLANLTNKKKKKEILSVIRHQFCDRVLVLALFFVILFLCQLYKNPNPTELMLLMSGRPGVTNSGSASQL